MICVYAVHSYHNDLADYVRVRSYEHIVVKIKNIADIIYIMLQLKVL